MDFFKEIMYLFFISNSICNCHHNQFALVCVSSCICCVVMFRKQFWRRKRKKKRFFAHIQKNFLLFTSKIFEEVQKYKRNMSICTKISCSESLFLAEQSKLMTAEVKDPICFHLEWKDLEPHTRHPRRTAFLVSS